MKRILILAALAALLISCTEKKNTNISATEKPIPIVEFEGVSPMLSKHTDTTYVINFWATWCSPCVKELPYFDRLAEEMRDMKVKVVLINLDFSNHYQSRLLPFIKEKGIKSEVIMLDDPDANSWINLVDPSWSGAIPATLIYKGGNRAFFEKEFTYQELKDATQSIIER